MIRFIDDEYHHPSDRLECVLKLDPCSTAPLDDLYTEILSLIPEDQETQQLRILHAIWQGGRPDIGRRMSLDPEQIDILLHLRDGTCRLILRRLYSLLAVSSIQTRFCIRHPIEVFHASFGDYLSDARRSRRWCISRPWLQADCLHCILYLLATPLLDDSQFYFYRYVPSPIPQLYSANDLVGTYYVSYLTG